MTVKFSSVKELAEALEAIEIPRIETHHQSGPGIALIPADPSEPAQILEQNWTEVSTDYPLWAERLATWAATR